MKAKHFRWVFIILILLIAVTFIKLPYYITQPGEASELRPLIKVDGGYPEKGSQLSGRRLKSFFTHIQRAGHARFVQAEQYSRFSLR